MAVTRRELLTLIGASVLAPRQAFPFQGAGAAAEPFPFGPLVAAFREDVRHAPAVEPTGLRRDGYLRVIQGIVEVFAAHQDERGAIIDPYEHAEKQYSTPAFALAAAALCSSRATASRVGPALLPRACRAMEAACADLAAGKAADGHADFFTVLLLHADRLLAPLAGRAAASRWRASLRAVVPEKVYRFQPTAKELHNWNLVAAAGEWLRTRDGYASTTGWIDASLARQVEDFTASGMYRDPNDPMAYDHFARLWALDLVEEKYRGVSAAALETMVERGAWMSAFMQSPVGELPCGGRSAHHQWNEAQQAVTFETLARRFARRGDRVWSGAFKRAARLSLQSIGRWVRPSGELWIVKNRLDPALRHGYESYSFHSQYNLLAASMLALAWARADDQIPEAPCPADVGGYAFALQPAFHKAFLAAAGWHVEIDTGADLHYNPTGILRVHRRGLPSELISDGVTPDCQYTVPSRPSRALAFGPEWRGSDGQWQALAAHGIADLAPTHVRIVRAAADGVEAELTYTGRLRGGATAVHEKVIVSSRGVDVEHVVEGDVSAVRQTVPVLADDGRETSRMGVSSVARGGVTLAVVPQMAHEVTRAGLREPCRNGFMDAFLLEIEGRRSRCRLEAGRGT